MRINRGRLDLRSLTIDQPCTIITGTSSIKLMHMSHTVEMGLYLKGVAPMRSSDQITSTEDERGNSGLTKWLHLNGLAPKRLYLLTVTSAAESGQPSGWQIQDATPLEPEESKRNGWRGRISGLFRKGWVHA